MKTLLSALILSTLALPAFATIKPVRLDGNKIVMSATGSETANLVWYVQEAQHADRDTAQGTIFWKRTTVEAPSEGLFTIDVDLAKAKSGRNYCVVIVNHTDGKKYKLYATITNGKFDTSD
jgi:hypothetical protein